MRRQSDFLHLSSCLADEVLFHTQPMLAGVRKPRDRANNKTSSAYSIMLMQILRAGSTCNHMPEPFLPNCLCTVYGK